ncbi:MAG TPA: hypothetical protein VD905_02990 [Flavobacteriales bacterium]|nr:hypothetical protein [Flavobacteriales bacterium]
MQTSVNNGDTLFTTNTYSQDFHLLETMVERITVNEAQLSEYLVGSLDPAVQAKSVSGTVLKWKQSKQEILSFSYEYSVGKNSYWCQKQRKWVGGPREQNFSESKVMAVSFRDSFIVKKNRKKVSSDQSYRFTHYASGIGFNLD